MGLGSLSTYGGAGSWTMVAQSWVWMYTGPAVRGGGPGTDASAVGRPREDDVTVEHRLTSAARALPGQPESNRPRYDDGLTGSSISV